MVYIGILIKSCFNLIEKAPTILAPELTLINQQIFLIFLDEVEIYLT